VWAPASISTRPAPGADSFRRADCQLEFARAAGLREPIGKLRGFVVPRGRGKCQATIGCSIRCADDASYFRDEDWITTDDFNANTQVLAGILSTQYYVSGLYYRTGSWNAANCLEAMESVIQANNGRRYREVLANSFKANSPKVRTIRHSFPGLFWAN